MNLDIVILAAGMGKRMFSDLPKVLHPVGGKAMLQHVIDSARQLQPRRLVVVVGHGADAVRKHCAADDIVFVDQPQQLGTGHAVQCALPALGKDGDTLVLYGDVPLLSVSTLKNLLALESGHPVLLTDRMKNPAGYGRIVRSPAQDIVAIVEHKDASSEQLQINEVNTGIMRLPNAHLAGWLGQLQNTNVQGEFYLTDVVAAAVGDGLAVHGVHPASSWEVMGVNSRVQQAELERHWQKQQAQTLLAAGVSLLDPERIDIRGALRCGRDVIIDINCIFEGQVELGDGVHIGPNCVIRNASIAAGTRVDAYTHIDQAKVGADVRLGPYARLRPGADIGNQAHIGNFVEIKKATVGLGSKVNHLTYIGDATIGRGVNVGAGTITCNYDGVNKWQTVIEDNVFVGSGSMLVAPVTLGEGSTIGAGSTITKNAPAGQLTLERAKQLTLSGWKRPQKKGLKV